MKVFKITSTFKDDELSVSYRNFNMVFSQKNKSEPIPIEGLFMAFNNCMSHTILYLATKEGIKIEQVDYAVSGKWNTECTIDPHFFDDPDANAGVYDITFDTTLQASKNGIPLTQDEKQKLLDDSARICPLHNTISHKTHINMVLNQ